MVKGITQKPNKKNGNKGPNNPKNNISQRHIQNKNRNRNNSSLKSVFRNRRQFNQKFSNKNILKSIKKEKYLEKKQNQSKRLKKEEEEIDNLENERDLFDADGFYKCEEQIGNENEWDDNNNFLAGNTINLSDLLFRKMTNVEEKKFDPRVVEAYSIVGNILSTYISGKLPKAFKILPSTENWEDLIEITKPESWTPQAMFEATIIFASNFGSELAEKFYSKVLLPVIRNNIRINKKLNIHLYNCLKKAIFKPAAFFKGIVLPMSENLTSKEAAIIGSILKKCSIPVTHSSACLMKLSTMKPGMGVLFFMKLLLLKKYAIPTKVKEALVKYFCSFAENGQQNNFNKISDDDNYMPVLWHQTLLVFVQFYKFDLTDVEKDQIRKLISNKNHHLITEDIYRELNYKVPTLENFKNLNASQMNID